LIASNFFDNVFEAEDIDGFDPSGLIVLQNGLHAKS